MGTLSVILIAILLLILFLDKIIQSPDFQRRLLISIEEFGEASLDQKVGLLFGYVVSGLGLFFLGGFYIAILHNPKPIIFLVAIVGMIGSALLLYAGWDVRRTY